MKLEETGRISGAIVVNTNGAISHARVWFEITAKAWPFRGLACADQFLKVSRRFCFSRNTLLPCGHSKKALTAGALFKVACMRITEAVTCGSRCHLREIKGKGQSFVMRMSNYGRTIGKQCQDYGNQIRTCCFVLAAVVK